MEVVIPLYENIKRVVSFFSKKLNFDKFKNKLGRKLALKLEEIISIGIFKQKNGIPTKRATYNTLRPKCSYKTLVVNLNRWSNLAAIILILMMKMNRANQHLIKYPDSTDIPVYLFKNAHTHKTMKRLADYGRSAKGTYFGLKMHIIGDFERQLLALKFTAAHVDDRKVVIPLSKDLWGIFIADTGYISKKLQEEFYQENKRILISCPKKNMKKMMTKFEEFLLETRMIIEVSFRGLKMFHGLAASLPRSVGGYLANYIYSLLTYQII